MKFSPPRLLKHRSTGVIRVRIKTPRGNQYLSTGQTSYERAREVVSQAMLEELQMAACAGALTPDVISRLTTGRRFTCEDIRAAWEADARLDLAPDTFHAYDTAIRAWLKAESAADSPISAIKRVAIDHFVNESGVAVGTRRGRLTALRAFFAFANHAGYCVGNLAARTRVQIRDLLFDQLEPRETLPLTAEEFERLMASPRCTGFNRWAAAFAWWLGWRLRDVACLEWASLREVRYVIYVRKTGRRLEIDTADPLFGGGALAAMVREIQDQPQTDARFCFPAERAMANAPTRRAHLSNDFRRMLHRHAIKGKRFHSLRHSCAMRLSAAGWSDEEIKLILGHRSAVTTALYTNHAPAQIGLDGQA